MDRNINQELLETIDAFLKGELSGDDLVKFNAQLANSPELREQVNLQRELFSSLNESGQDWTLADESSIPTREEVSQEDYKMMSDKISKVAESYKNADTPKVIPFRSKFRKYGYAAAIALMLVASISLFKIFTSNNAFDYSHAQWASHLPSFTEKSNDMSSFTQAESQFKSQNFESAIQLFRTIDVDNKYYPYSLMYLGACYDLLDKDTEAIAAFDKLINLENFEDRSNGYWFKSLIYLQSDQRVEAVAALNQVLDDKNNQYYNQAKELLDTLD